MNEMVTMSLPCKSEYVSVARLTASYIASQMNFDVEAIEDIKMAVGEACNNAVLHSGMDSIYEMKILNKGKAICIEISDTGKGFMMEEYQEPHLEELKENGLGLFIIKSLMDSVNIVTQKGNGTKIIMEKEVE